MTPPTELERLSNPDLWSQDNEYDGGDTAQWDYGHGNPWEIAARANAELERLRAENERLEKDAYASAMEVARITKQYRAWKAAAGAFRAATRIPDAPYLQTESEREAMRLLNAARQLEEPTPRTHARDMPVDPNPRRKLDEPSDP